MGPLGPRRSPPGPRRLPLDPRRQPPGQSRLSRVSTPRLLLMQKSQMYKKVGTELSVTETRPGDPDVAVGSLGEDGSPEMTTIVRAATVVTGVITEGGVGTAITIDSHGAVVSIVTKGGSRPLRNSFSRLVWLKRVTRSFPLIAGSAPRVS